MLRARLTVSSSSRPRVRTFSVTRSCLADADLSAPPVEAESTSEGSGDNKKNKQGRASRDNSHNAYIHWLQTEGEKYRRPTDGPNWLLKSPSRASVGLPPKPDGPFPQNPTFRPPTPMSHSRRQEMYERHMADPKGMTVRKLAAAYGVSITRAEAVLRLQHLESSWAKDSTKELQTGFQAHMEVYLGIDQPSESVFEAARRQAGRVVPIAAGASAGEVGLQAKAIPLSNRDLALMADEQTESDTPEDRAARHRYQRMFWEDTPEDENPILPGVLESVRQHAKALAQAKQRRFTSHTQGDVVVTGLKASPQTTKPPTRFVDVGTKFMDKKEVERRAKASERRRQKARYLRDAFVEERRRR